MCAAINRQLFAVLLCLLGLPLLALAQGNRPDLVGVKAWRGTVTATAKDANEQLGGNLPAGTSGKLQFEASFTADVLLDQFENEPAVWSGKVISSTLSINSTLVTAAGDAKVVNRYATKGPAEASNDPVEAKLTFHRERGWSLSIYRNTRKTEATTETTVGKEVFKEQSEITVRGPANYATFPYPEKGFDLEGKVDAEPALNADEFPVVWQYTVHLYPADRQVLTLEIEDSSAYQDWRPSATRDGGAGLPLELKATIVASDGKTPNTKVKSFVWELEKTSREPGVTMNYPLNAKDNRLDLELTTQGGMFVISPDAQRVERAVSEGFSDTVSVVPYDWGGWADLKVTANMEVGPPLIGKIKGASEDGLRLPKRAADSKIADVWKKQKSVTAPDDSDFDNIPAVPAHKGDGLTLYEEYRGFYEKGQRVEGNPDKKDLFVLDTTGLMDGGLKKFEKESKILIHRLDKGEMDEQNHLINQNRTKGPHLVAQHGILVKLNTEAGAYMAADPQGAASPGGVRAILVPKTPATGPAAPDGTPYNDVSFAHEVMHALGVRHHGDGDYEAFWKIEGDTVKEYHLNQNSELSRSGTPIEIFHEDGSPATAGFIAHFQAQGGFHVLVGVEQGESSGDDTCMMRYDRNSAYVKHGQPNARVSIQPGVNDEPVGYRICTSRTGTGVNVFNPGPSRFGNAAPNRGNCADKLKVSDL